MDWLLQQAQTASPFVSVFCLTAAGVLYRQHIKDQATILSIANSSNEAMAKAAVAIEGLTGVIRQSLEKRGRR